MDFLSDHSNNTATIPQELDPVKQKSLAPADPPIDEEEQTLEALFELSKSDTTTKQRFESSTWDSFNSDIREYLLSVTPQTEREEVRNEKLSSCFFLDKGNEFTDRYIEQEANNVYDSNGAGSLLSMDYLMSCLGLLICGYQSRLFILNEKKRVFTTSSKDVKFRTSGLTAKSVAGIVEFCLAAGSRTERLRYTSRVIYTHASTAGPILVAFANCINIILEAVAHHVDESKSLQLIDFYNTVYTPISVITMLAELLGCDDLSKALALNRLPSSWKLLNALYSRCMMLESANEKLYHLVKMVLKSAADQWFDKLEDFIGLGEQFNQFWSELDERKTSDFFTKITSDLGIHLFSVDEDKVPDFFNMQTAENSVNIMNCLLLLANYSNEDVMLHLQGLKKVKLRWSSGTTLQTEVLRYRADVMKVYKLLVETDHQSPDAEIESTNEIAQGGVVVIEQKFFDTPNEMDEIVPLFSKISLDGPRKEPESLKTICYDLFNSTADKVDIQIPIQAATNVSVSDLISIQSWLMNSLTLSIVFNHGPRKLINHMVLIRQVMLLGSGNLIFDLEDMIFGSMNNARVPLMCSLNIGVYGAEPGRRSPSQWPPSSAETNRALPHCVEKAITGLGDKISGEVRDLECMNFGMRQVKGFSGDCQSLDATRVFYIVYNPPDPLSIIITSKARNLYNRMFSRLLQIMHARHAVKQLAMRSLRENEEFEVSSMAVSQSINLLNILGNHFTSVVINHIWQPWEHYLTTKVFAPSIGGDIDDSTDIAVDVVPLSELIARHSKVAGLLSMCFFQTPSSIHLSTAIDLILSAVLRLAKLTLNNNSAPNAQEPGQDVKGVQETETEIHENIIAFLQALYGYTEEVNEPTVQELTKLLFTQLTYNGFYTK